MSLLKIFSRRSSARPILGIDASRNVSPQPTGVERYSRAIIRALLELGLAQDFELRLYTPSPLHGPEAAFQRVLWWPRLWTLFRLSLELLLHAPDLLFVPAHVLPFFVPRRCFVMLHDVAFCRHPEAYTRFQNFYLRWSTRRALRLCERVFVPSQAVAQDLAHFFKADLKRIVVIPHGVTRLKPSPSVLPFAAESSSTPTFFYVGRLDHKKNLLTLLRAWEQVQAQKPGAQLVLAGKKGDAFTEIEAFLKNKNLSVSHGRYVSDKELEQLYQTARALVYPSLEEGFGLPVLEAFEANCPVICSAIPALKEVGGSAAVLCEPQRPEAFAEAMLRLADDAEEVERLRALGRERVKDFSWEKAAQMLKAVLESPAS